MVSAIACTCAVLTGSGSEATAASIAIFISAIVSGENDAFETSFISYQIYLRVGCLVDDPSGPTDRRPSILLMFDHHLNQLSNLVASEIA